MSLLPLPNRDTFWALLKFLAKVVEHSKDTIDEHGNEVCFMNKNNQITLHIPTDIISEWPSVNGHGLLSNIINGVRYGIRFS